MSNIESKSEDLEAKIKEIVEDELILLKNQTEELEKQIAQLKSITGDTDTNIKTFNQFYKDNFESENTAINKVDIFKQNLATLGDLEQQLKSTKDRISDLETETVGVIGKIKIAQENILGDGEKAGLEKEIVIIHRKVLAIESELFKSGLKDKIEAFYNEYLIAQGADGKNKIETAKEDIESIAEFNNQIKTTIKKSIEDKFKDIESLKSEVEATLSITSINSLGLGYKQSMMLYGHVDFFEKRSHRFLSWDTAKFIAQILISFFTGLFNYVLFITPLLMVLCVFVEPKFIEKFTLLDFSKLKYLDGWEYVIFKISVSVPMLWISWYGQKNITTRKRLFEEYNHKFRVVQMYLAFIGKKEVYNLDNKVELERTLLEIVSRNPASFVYRKDDTFLDKITSLAEVFKKPFTPSKE